VDTNNTSLTEVAPKANIHHGRLSRRVILPVLVLLRMGASPRRLAWSIAVGFVIGVNPLLGSTTILCLAVAMLFRLNVAASQLGNHIVYPLQLLMFVPFLRLGSIVFGTPPMPLAPTALMEAARSHPVSLVREIWRWEWHAFAVWAALSAVVVPLIALAMTPVLRRLMTRVEKRQYPIAS